MKYNEANTIRFMIDYYCKKIHKGAGLCPECEELSEYAAKRLINCRYGADKPVCQKCATHCYISDKREKIRKVMRYSGPRMIFLNPPMALIHLIHSIIK